ncbi:histidine--tRNA ligase [Candidatus Woesebacteria bacterium]|nr:histidine--tRNA ligase [Candidatus Woesebacteria bacterium]
MNLVDKIKVQTLKGFRDFLPEQARKRQYVINTLRGVFESYGFEPLETPALEYEEVLTGKYGEEGNKLMYRFTDNGGRKVALRYDQTVPLTRVVAQYGDKLPKPFKRYQIQPVWRAENPQKGRYREFLQCDIDTVGTKSLLADAEIIACTVGAVRKLGIKSAKMQINDRAVFENLKPEFVSAIDKLEKIGKEGVVKELVAKGMNDAQKYVDSLTQEKPSKNVLAVFKMLKDMGLTEGVDFEFKPSLARGMDYYTGVIFELVDSENPSLSFAGGGRYDNLIGMFSKQSVPAVGIGFGFDRLVETLEEKKLFPKDLVSTKVIVTIFSPDLTNQSIKVASQLRDAGINTELYSDEAKLDKQLKYANKQGIPWVLVIGPEESKNDVVKLKNMETRKEESLSVTALIKKLK